MEFTNEFRVPADADTVFRTITDLERVAPCMPGATLEEVDGATYTGRMKVKLGPVQVVYRGTAKLTDVDADAKRAAIRARGKEARGAGTANADVTATLAAEGGETQVTVVTDLDITGKPAQFSRGVMAEVGTKIIDQFAERLQAMLTEGDGGRLGGSDAASTGVAAAPTAGALAPRQVARAPERANEALDLMEVAGSATAKRLAPLLGALVIVVLLWWRRRG